MNDRRNFFEKLGRSLKLEDEQYPQVDLTEQDFLNQDEEAMLQEEEVVGGGHSFSISCFNVPRSKARCGKDPCP